MGGETNRRNEREMKRVRKERRGQKNGATIERTVNIMEQAHDDALV